MSYSLTVSGANKADVQKKLADEFETIVKNQPVHIADREVAEQAVNDFVGIMDVGAGQQIQVAVYGSVTTSAGDEPKVTSASVNIAVSVV